MRVESRPPQILRCPGCSKQTVWSARNAYRPFCSERCRLIDLGEWASEGHVIAGHPLVDDVLSGDLEPDVDR